MKLTGTVLIIEQNEMRNFQDSRFFSNFQTFSTTLQYLQGSKLNVNHDQSRVYHHTKTGNHRKSYMVIYENMKVIECSIEVYGNMQVIKSPYYSMIPWKSYTVP